MNEATNAKTDAAAAFVFRIEREFKTSLTAMWDAWTDPEQMAQWFGPKGCPVFHSTIDLRPDGLFHYGMRTPDGDEIWGKWLYKEIDPPHKLVSIVSFSGADSRELTRHPWDPDWPLYVHSTVTFSENNGMVKVLVEWLAYEPTAAERERFAAGQPDMNEGWGGTLDQLQEFLG